MSIGAGDNQVGCHGKFDTGAKAPAFDRSDHRFAKAADCLPGKEAFTLQWFVVAEHGDLADISACGEDRAAASDDDRAHGFVHIGRLDSICYLAKKRRRKSVAKVGAIYGQQSYEGNWIGNQ
ncbi:hypothetical protein ACVWZA_003113 [Sphingomonas sp. UYAg733]